MLKKTITFNDLDGNPITEDFYFHLNKAEVTEMELSQKGGLSGYLREIIAEDDPGKLIAMFKEIILKTVGERSEDGRRFIKNDEIRDDFMQTEAYSELFMELATNAEAAAGFMTGVIPPDLAEQVSKEVAGKSTEDVALPEDTEPAWIRENRDPTQAELVTMSPAQLQEAFRRKAEKQGTPPPA